MWYFIHTIYSKPVTIEGIDHADAQYYVRLRIPYKSVTVRYALHPLIYNPQLLRNVCALDVYHLALLYYSKQIIHTATVPASQHQCCAILAIDDHTFHGGFADTMSYRNKNFVVGSLSLADITNRPAIIAALNTASVLYLASCIAKYYEQY
jgi:hypothetical protein